MNRDPEGRFAVDDPLQSAMSEAAERNERLLAKFFRREPTQEGESTATDQPERIAGDFDQGVRGSGIAPRPGMNELLREAASDLRSGASEVTIELTDGEIRRY